MTRKVLTQDVEVDETYWRNSTSQTYQISQASDENNGKS